ncbi:hypothetical protein niasHS_009369 [Heterodera schachtii]|uniref:Uncharacterized protein n=1 Tax=Heterodera schachtii TaxID=97005 RepID=A0ABD2JBV2_HETSC
MAPNAAALYSPIGTTLLDQPATMSADGGADRKKKPKRHVKKPKRHVKKFQHQRYKANRPKQQKKQPRHLMDYLKSFYFGNQQM